MARHKKNRRIRRIVRRSLRDYTDITQGVPSPLENSIHLKEWTKHGDFFAKFTLYDESQISYTSSGTNYTIG